MLLDFQWYQFEVCEFACLFLDGLFGEDESSNTEKQLKNAIIGKLLQSEHGAIEMFLFHLEWRKKGVKLMRLVKPHPV